MNNLKLRQDNRVTMARYELSVIEKRVMYFILKEIRKQYVLNKDGQRDLFDDLIVDIDGGKLVKEVYEDNKERVKRSLKALRQRSFEYEDETEDQWFEVGFIDWSGWNKGKVQVQISKKILPFYVELSERYTEYSLVVAMSLRSKYSQRLYELCSQWRAAGGFNVELDEFREMFQLGDKYSRYAAFKSYVLEVARKELKELFDKGECDLYFNYSEIKEGRSVKRLQFKVVSASEVEQYTIADYDYFTRTKLHELFQTKTKPKNRSFVEDVMTSLRLDPEKLKHCYQKLLSVEASIPPQEQAPYMRFVINAEYLNGQNQ